MFSGDKFHLLEIMTNSQIFSQYKHLRVTWWISCFYIPMTVTAMARRVLLLPPFSHRFIAFLTVFLMIH